MKSGGLSRMGVKARDVFLWEVQQWELPILYIKRGSDLYCVEFIWYSFYVYI
jgi:hypothetical protein